MNSINLIGRLTKDPELRKTGSGISVANFQIAVDGGKEETYFFPVIVWKELADTTMKFVKKGNRVGVSGRLTQRSYEKDGRKNSIVEIVADRIDFLEPKQTQNEVKEEHIEIQTDDMPF